VVKDGDVRGAVWLGDTVCCMCVEMPPGSMSRACLFLWSCVARYVGCFHAALLLRGLSQCIVAQVASHDGNGLDVTSHKLPCRSW
jgi:hypothetical protein